MEILNGWKSDNKNNQQSLQDIINNFNKTDSVIKKYITEFKPVHKKKNFF